MIKKENEVFVTYDRKIIEDSMDIRAFDSCCNVMMNYDTMEFIEKMLKSQQNLINKQLENLSILYFKLVGTIKFLQENLEDINEYWKNLRFDIISSDNNDKIISVDWCKSFDKLNIADLDNIINVVIDTTKEKIEDLNNVYIILNKIKMFSLKGYSYTNEEDDNNKEVADAHNVKDNDIIKIDVIKELIDYLPNTPVSELTMNEMISKAEDMLFDFNMITFIFYIEIIDEYKNSKEK